jgi:hypothetical protein
VRTTTAGELLTLAKNARTVTQRVKVANGSGTMIDLSSWVESVVIDRDVDMPVSGATIQFTRSEGNQYVIRSLAPLRTDSTLNRLDDGVTYSPQLDLNRVVTVEEATTAIGASIVAGDYKLKFKGTIDSVNFEQSPVTIQCRDEGAVLVDRWIETPATYGTGGGRGMELVIQDILDAVFGAAVIVLYVPTSPAYNITTYQQQKMSVMDAIQQLAQLKGWDIRFRYYEPSGIFKLTLSDPLRSKTTPDYTFGPSQYHVIPSFDINLTNIRNFIQGSYFNAATQSRLTVSVNDSASITKYGRRFFEIQEGDQSPIDTSTEMTNLITYALADLKDPKANQEVELPFFWPGDLNDLYRFSGNAATHNTDQDLAVVSIRDELSQGRHRTIAKVRGSPAGQYLTWLARGDPRTSPNGVPYAPIARIDHLNTEGDDTGWGLRFIGYPGAGGGGANLTYTIKSKIAFAAESTLFSGDASTLPKDATIGRHPRSDTDITFICTDTATTLFAVVKITVPSQRTEVDNTGQIKSSGLAAQGSILPATTATLPFSYNAGGPGAAGMWMAWTWGAFTIYKPDATTISVGASSGLATPGTPALSQVAGGALGARTYFVRYGYVKNLMVYHIGAEASLAVLANNYLKITSPASVTGYDGWIALIGTATNTEWFQAGFPIAFGTDYTESGGGATLSGCPYNNANMPAAVTSTFLDPSTTYYFYPWWDILAGFVAFSGGGSIAKSVTGANAQNSDGRIAISALTAMTGLTPTGGTTGSGTGTNGGGKLL